MNGGEASPVVSAVPRSSTAQSFERIWSKTPFGYQEKVTESLLADRNVILVAPTGSGKTMAALHPFVQARELGLPWADRLIYALPLRMLTGALYAQYGANPGVGSTSPDPVSENGRALARLGLRVTMQTGLHKDDPAFRGDICFATIDQVLSAYVGAPVSVSRGQANIPGGALVGAYVVFDEIHLLEPRLALGTALDLARRLAGLARVLFMTATAPTELVDYLRQALDADVVAPSAEDLANMPAQSTKRRYYSWHPEPLTPERIIDGCRDRTIAVFNTVERAQNAYRRLTEDLRDKLPSGVKPLLLHSRFVPSHRLEKETEVLRLFAEGSTARALLIATQVVEVGLDVSCQSLLTEVSPASSLVQRAGRCARFMKEEGEVLVFDVPEDKAHPYAPYSTADGESTRAALEAWLGRESHLTTFDDELAFVNQALGDASRQAVGELKALRARREMDVANYLRTATPDAYRQTVRDIDTVSVIVHGNPECIDLRAGVEPFPVSSHVLRGFFRELGLVQDRGTGHEPTMAIASGAETEATCRVADDRATSPERPGRGFCVLRPDLDTAEAAEARQERLGPLHVKWVPVQDVREALAQVLLCLSPEVASYDSELGLRLGEAGTWETPTTGLRRGNSKGNRRGGVRESFRQHALDVATRVRVMAEREARVALHRLANLLGLPTGKLVALLGLVGGLHDLGKLGAQWQKTVQLAEFGVTSVAEFLAHTSRSDLGPAPSAARSGAGPGTPATQPGARPSTATSLRLPPHSVAGACAAWPILSGWAAASLEPDAKPPLLAASVMAIARHHSAHSTEFGGFVPARGCDSEIRAIVRDLMGVRTAEVSDPAALDRASRVEEVETAKGSSLIGSALVGIDPAQHPLNWALYWIMVRLLRLADQEAQAELKRKAITAEQTGGAGSLVSGGTHEREATDAELAKGQVMDRSARDGSAKDD